MELSEEIIARLENEGFSPVYEWYDEPHTVHAEHSHEEAHSIVVAEGQITFSVDDTDTTLGPNERIDVPARTLHCARVGHEGCKYVIGEKAL